MITNTTTGKELNKHKMTFTLDLIKKQADYL